MQPDGQAAERESGIEPRRYLLCRSSGNPRDVNILWLDVHGSCNRYHQDFHGNLYPVRFHLHRDKDHRWYAALCPNGLASEEWDRVGVDDPPGSWRMAFVHFKNEAPPVRRSEFTEAV